jgi:hypothetical protein
MVRSGFSHWAGRADIGQVGAQSGTIVADPEGNEFCVKHPQETLTT